MRARKPIQRIARMVRRIHYARGVALRPNRAFELHEPVARGGMGEVWRATHVPSGALVAVKLAVGDLATDAEFVHHFRNEDHWLGVTSNLGDRIMRTLPKSWPKRGSK